LLVIRFIVFFVAVALVVYFVVVLQAPVAVIAAVSLSSAV